MKNTRFFCLFAGRHTLPNNPTPLFGDSANPLHPETGEGFDRALASFSAGEVVRLYVTGATYALTQFIAACLTAQQMGAQGSLVLLHYDRDSGEYIPQVLVYNERHKPRFKEGFSVVQNSPEDYWDGSYDNLTPAERGTVWCPNPDQAYDIRFQIGVQNGTIDPYDCE